MMQAGDLKLDDGRGLGFDAVGSLELIDFRGLDQDELGAPISLVTCMV